MILHIHSDAFYISENEAKAEQGGSFTRAASPTPTKKIPTGQF
jgi:hypothetical protein